ncbi:hypothetical protein B0H10DRAFT_1961586 [Mycena sp. CBHHK59/15]|nr:hypothetical protein B0H10DRAFT_1961586 [Mycena sp. CBHHK59/15]
MSGASEAEALQDMRCPRWLLPAYSTRTDTTPCPIQSATTPRDTTPRSDSNSHRKRKTRRGGEHGRQRTRDASIGTNASTDARPPKRQRASTKLSAAEAWARASKLTWALLTPVRVQCTPATQKGGLSSVQTATASPRPSSPAHLGGGRPGKRT